MLGKYAAAYVIVVETIDTLISNLNSLGEQNDRSSSDTNTNRMVLALMGKEPRLPDDIGAQTKGVLENLLHHLSSRMTFPSVAAQVRRITDSIGNGEGPKALSAQMRELRTRLKDELNERDFLYVPLERVRFYKEQMLFGRAVNDRFPTAIDDIEDAGKCLAIGQGTACVLHTMRILEVGLKALAKALKIPYAPSWESYLTQISTNIAKKHKNKTAAWKKDQAFYRDLSGDLVIIKQAFRNPTMHADRKYSTDEAEQIFNGAKSFMSRMANHFNEKELAKLLK